MISAKSYRVQIHHRLPVRIQWRQLGQHGGRWYDQLDWSTGDPIEFPTVEQAQDWIAKQKDRRDG